MLTNLSDSQKRQTPPPPEEATAVLKVGDSIVACSPDPGRPATFSGPPSCWTPEEPGDLGAVWLLLPSKGKWVQAEISQAEHLEEQIWEVWDDIRKSDWDNYLDEDDY